MTEPEQGGTGAVTGGEAAGGVTPADGDIPAPTATTTETPAATATEAPAATATETPAPSSNADDAARGDAAPSEAPAPSALRRLEPSEIRARRRPRAIVLVWAWELACAFFIATPVHAWARNVWGAHPDGDAAIFRPGGHALLSWLGDEGAALAIVVRSTILALAVFGILGQIVTGTLIASLATGAGKSGRAPPTSFALRAGSASFFPLLALGVVAGAIEGAVLGVGLFASSALDHALAPRFGDARAFTARLALLALFVIATLVIGVVADLARVTIARDVAAARAEAPATSASMLGYLRGGVVAAVTTARRAVGRASLAWGWRAAASIALIYAGATAGDVTGGRGGGALWLLFAFHQLVVLARAALRASWLAYALRLVGR
ncbi:MAG: hypothetical protein KF795_06635 [Labilithrix sp.]|nr:hypothetical protein [Labilithrix sp.]